MTTLKTAMKISRPSAVIARSMTDAERYALNTRELALVIDPSERAQEYPGVTLRDRIGARPVAAMNGSIILDGATPALHMPNTSRATVNFTLPASYFIAVAVDVDTLYDTGAFAYSFDTTENRLFFGLLAGPGGSLRFDHGTAGGNILTHTGGAWTGKHVYWCSYDAATGAAALGMDAITPVKTGQFTGPHKAHPKTDFFGGTGIAGMDGRAYLGLVADRYLGGPAEEGIRAALLAWCAERAGVTLEA